MRRVKYSFSFDDNLEFNDRTRGCILLWRHWIVWACTVLCFWIGSNLNDPFAGQPSRLQEPENRRGSRSTHWGMFTFPWLQILVSCSSYISILIITREWWTWSKMLLLVPPSVIYIRVTRWRLQRSPAQALNMRPFPSAAIRMVDNWAISPPEVIF